MDANKINVFSTHFVSFLASTRGFWRRSHKMVLNKVYFLNRLWAMQQIKSLWRKFKKFFTKQEF